VPPERDAPGTAEGWLKRAKGDLALCRAPLPKGAFLEDLCYHAQQAAEKALKAVYRRNGWVFRYTHDLDELIEGVRAEGLEVPPEIAEAVILNSYSAEARYPSLSEPVNTEEYHEAVRLAEAVVAWAEKEILK